VSLIGKTGADAIVADCGSCRMQLESLSGMPSFDPVEILCESLGMTGQKTMNADKR
jgi:Fe-S oxidoreductase